LFSYGDAIAVPGGGDELPEEFEFGWSCGMEFINKGRGEVFKDTGIFGFGDEVLAVGAVH
jgi:hypothetical protein